MSTRPFVDTLYHILFPGQLGTKFHVERMQHRWEIGDFEYFDLLRADEILASHSRTFLQATRLMYGPIQLWISVAYSLARVADVFQDTVMPTELRNELLRAYLNAIRDRDKEALFGSVVNRMSNDRTIRLNKQDRRTLVNSHFILLHFWMLPSDAQCLILRFLTTMIEGMIQFSGEWCEMVKTNADLDYNFYVVAGCIGSQFLTPAFIADHPRLAEAGITDELAKQVGLRLQYANAVIDIADDIATLGYPQTSVELIEATGLPSAPEEFRNFVKRDTPEARRLVRELILSMCELTGRFRDSVRTYGEICASHGAVNGATFTAYAGMLASGSERLIREHIDTMVFAVQHHDDPAADLRPVRLNRRAEKMVRRAALVAGRNPRLFAGFEQAAWDMSRYPAFAR